MRPLIAAHRGGAALWPENSLDAIRRAVALPVAEVEIDVHLAADGVPMVIHDPTLDRTTEGRGPVRERTAAELGELRLRGAATERVPTLAAAAALVRDGGKTLRLELKTDAAGRPDAAAVAACGAVLDACGMRARTVVISFAPATIASAARSGFAGTGLLFGERAWFGLGAELAVGMGRLVGADELGVPFGLCDPAMVAVIRRGRLRLGAWGVDDAAAFARATALGLDVATTDDPVALVAVPT